jgi:hypothetical protein
MVMCKFEQYNCGLNLILLPKGMTLIAFSLCMQFVQWEYIFLAFTTPVSSLEECGAWGETVPATPSFLK